MNLNTFTTALSGLNANAQGLSVVGNNLANLNTVGFKQSNISFVDVLGQAFSSGVSGSGNVNLGLGTQVGSVRANFAAGATQTTNNPYDVAIQGKGLLVLNSPDGKYYSRAGNLHKDDANNLVADNGMAVQGYVRNPTTGQIDPNLGLQNIHLPSGLESPVKTTTFATSMNLSADAADGTQYSTSIQIFDSLGTAHQATLTFQKDSTAGTPPVTTWKFDITIPQKDVAGADPSSTEKYSLLTGAVADDEPAAGSLVFDAAGQLKSAYYGAAPANLPALANITIPPAGGSMPVMAKGGTLSSGITWNLVDSDGTSPVTGLSAESGVSKSSQNGAGPGTFNNLSILGDGTVSAVFSNGKTVPFAQIVLAQFGNVDGLVPAGGGLYQESQLSGASFIGAPGDGGRGRLIGGALEQSNVDLATELTKIITYQRAYQANAKLITTTDDIMQQTMAMVR